MLTIGSAPDPDAMHFTQGVVKVVGGSIWIFYLFYAHTYFLSLCVS